MDLRRLPVAGAQGQQGDGSEGKGVGAGSGHEGEPSSADFECSSL